GAHRRRDQGAAAPGRAPARGDRVRGRCRHRRDGDLMSSGTTDFEALLREALTPVDPPADLVARLELTLINLTELAQEELDSWELAAMRDPRNWVRPAAAAVVGVTAGTALVVLRVRSRHRDRKQQSSNLIDLAERTMHDVADEARRILPNR